MVVAREVTLDENDMDFNKYGILIKFEFYVQANWTVAGIECPSSVWRGTFSVNNIVSCLTTRS